MENKLEELKEKMDETILRDVCFDDKQYHFVLNTIKTSKLQKQPTSFRNKFNFLISFSVISIMFFMHYIFCSNTASPFQWWNTRETSK